MTMRNIQLDPVVFERCLPCYDCYARFSDCRPFMKPKDLLKRAKREGNPLIDGETVTFAWKGKHPPYLLGDFNFWNIFDSGYAEFERGSKKIWTYTTQIPADAYIEYVYFKDLEDRDSRLLDPLNKKCKVSNGMKKYNNYFNMPQAEHTKLIHVKEGIPRGTLSKHKLKAPAQLFVGKKRALWLYRPPTDAEVPLLVVFDGKQYLKRARITHIVDNLIAAGRIQPIALALIDNAGWSRLGEYHSSEGMLLTIMEGILPVAQKVLNLISTDQQPGAYGVLGASMGGLMALYTGLRLPKLFGHVITQSGTFMFDYPNAESHALVDLLLKALPRHDLKIWQDVGRYEWLIDKNREMRARLESRGYDVTYREFNGGHNYIAWRDMLPEALEIMFGTGSQSTQP
jgi:enterochelin esterase-like enzyme